MPTKCSTTNTGILSRLSTNARVAKPQKVPIKWTDDKKTRVVTKQYKTRGRGKKENFKKKKDTIMSKADTLARESDARVLVLMHQAHLDQWHLYQSPNSLDEHWPFDLEQFQAKHKVVATQISCVGPFELSEPNFLQDSSDNESSSCSSSVQSSPRKPKPVLSTLVSIVPFEDIRGLFSPLHLN